MKKTLATIIVLSSCAFVNAYENPYDYSTRKIYKDVYNHTYKNVQTLDKDSDGDGVTNRYDYNDRNKNIQYDWQRDWMKGK